jgi:metal-sulfur cluster biosynthetic enzyme
MTEETKTETPETAVRPEPQVTTPAAGAPEDLSKLTDDIIAALKTVYDPEIPATVDMTLTTPNCPAAQELPQSVENAVASVAGTGPVKVNIVWQPPWDPSRMSDEARVVLNMW